MKLGLRKKTTFRSISRPGLSPAIRTTCGVIYAVFSLMPYAEVWRMAIEGGNLLARIDPISLAGGLSFCVLVLIGGGLAARHLSRRRAAAHSPR